MRDSVPSGAIQAFVMYCVNGTSRSSLLIESTDSMIIIISCCYWPGKECLFVMDL